MVQGDPGGLRGKQILETQIQILEWPILSVYAPTLGPNRCKTPFAKILPRFILADFVDKNPANKRFFARKPFAKIFRKKFFKLAYSVSVDNPP